MKSLQLRISLRVLLLAVASAVFATPVCTHIVFGDGGQGQGTARRTRDRGSAVSQDSKRGISVRANDVKALPSAAKRWALIIGIDQYDDADINPLAGAVKDARTLKQALVKDSGFPADNVTLLTSDSRDKDLKPTRSNIIYRLSTLANQVPPDGLLLFAFSGHGVEVDGKAFLLPEESKLSKDTLYLTDNAVSVDRVKEYINRTGVKQRLMLLDACRSKLSTGKGIDVAPMTKSYEKAFDFNYEIKNRSIDAFLTFYATGMGQESWEDPDTGQGYFTEAVVEALNGGRNGEILNSSGEVTLGALTKYVRDTVAERTKRAGKVQVPHPVTDGYGEDLVIAKVEGKRPAEANMASAPSQVLTEEILAASEISYWNSIASKSNPELFKNYLEEYPNGRFAKPAATFLRDLEEPYWKSIAASGDPRAFKTYTDIYPDGRFVELAKESMKKLEESYWNSVKSSGDPRAFSDYLSLYPNGRFAAEAKRRGG
ncbi:MAG TPA: caspase family protein, partial [Blastocatellia bacterium]|nr:caspase family protein [Blastocatellia bacterium]